MSKAWQGPLEQIDEYRWRIPRSYRQGMRTDGLVFADEELLSDIKSGQALEQVADVSFLPGIVGSSLAMPDIHWGYGFPVGGVAAVDMRNGVISPGGIGFDCNCGIRLLRSDLSEADVRKRLTPLMDALEAGVPTGVGSQGKIDLSPKEMDAVLTEGMGWTLQQGYAWEDDLERAEEGGRMAGADPAKVSRRARQRGRRQLGTLGSGNHFVEVGVVREVFDAQAAESFGLEKGSVTVMIHSGSRGLGHQVATDAIKTAEQVSRQEGYDLPDRQLAATPINSRAGKDYMAALAGASNYAWANRQMMTHYTRQAFSQVFQRSAQDLGLGLVYDHAHNIAKVEEHQLGRQRRRVLVHRKGACRAFPAGHPAVPAAYRQVGHPVFVPGDMGRTSFVLVGTDGAMAETFGSVCHGAGRQLSRTEARRRFDLGDLRYRLASQGIEVRAGGRGMLEEAPEAYKDVNKVVDVVTGAGLARRVVRLEPMGVLKG